MSESLQTTAIQEFRSARFRANMEIIRSHLTGRSADLLSYDDVRKKVRARETNRHELKEIPVAAIVGSVGRYNDFTRQFLPRMEEDQDRWARVYALTGSMQGMPPIEVYQIGDVYFVSDGNHRVSVARSHKVSHIEAYVTQLETDVPLEADLKPDDLIVKERYANFLARTRLKETYPDLDLSMTEAGSYRVLEQQIGVHQWWVKEFKGQEITYPEAAVRWYKYIYWPVIQMIRERGIMCDFPDRTETDLYVWIDEHRKVLAEELEWSVDADTAVSDLVATQSKRPQRVMERLSSKVASTLTPDALEAAPESGIWREAMRDNHLDEHLFPRILVALNGQDSGWLALRAALQVARLEEARLFGLHVVKKKDDKNSAAVEALRGEFERRCQEASIAGEMSVEVGKVARTIADRARWTDLVVVSLAYPPGSTTVKRLGSSFRKLLRRSPRPVLAIPRTLVAIDKLLLAYDGTPKAQEALYMTAYLAQQWQLPLVIVTVLEKNVTEETAARAQSYLQEHNIQASFIQRAGEPAQVISDTAKVEKATLIIMGGYGQAPFVEVFVGSTVGQVLRIHDVPILICR